MVAFWSIFGNILSYLSSNIRNEGKTFNPPCNTCCCLTYFVPDVCKRLPYFASSFCTNYCYYYISSTVFHELYKLFIIARKSRRNKGISTGIKKTFSWKNTSSSLLAAACFVVLSIPVFIYIGIKTNSEYSLALDNANITALW